MVGKKFSCGRIGGQGNAASIMICIMGYHSRYIGSFFFPDFGFQVDTDTDFLEPPQKKNQNYTESPNGRSQVLPNNSPEKEIQVEQVSRLGQCEGQPRFNQTHHRFPSLVNQDIDRMSIGQPILNQESVDPQPDSMIGG